MADRFQPQFINPGCPTDFVVKLHRRLPNYLDTEKLSLWWNGKILLNRRPGRGSRELPNDCIQTRGQLGIAYSKSNPLVCGQTFGSDERVESIRPRLNKSQLRGSRKVEIPSTSEFDAERTFPQPGGRAVTGDLDTLGAGQVPIK